MKRSLLLFAALTLLSTAALADPSPASAPPSTPPPSTAAVAPAPIDPAKRALIEEMLQVMRTEEESDKLTQAILDDAPDIVQQIMPSQDGVTMAEQDEAKQAAVKEIARFKDLFKQQVDVRAIARSVSFALYDKYFTDDEIKDLIAFYKTPTGQKAIEILPQLSEESMKLTDEALAPKVKAIVQQLQDEQTNALSSQPQSSPSTATK